MTQIKKALFLAETGLFLTCSDRIFLKRLYTRLESFLALLAVVFLLGLGLPLTL